jgi:ABC-type transport system substrate-binding protein
MRLRTLSMVFMVLGLLLFALALASCAPDTTAPTLAVSATQVTSEAAQPTPLRIADAGTAVATLEPFTDTACLDCHTNQERLESLAIPEEDSDHEALSSGPG